MAAVKKDRELCTVRWLGGVATKKKEVATPRKCGRKILKCRRCWLLFVLSLFHNTIICIVFHCSIILLKNLIIVLGVLIL